MNPITPWAEDDIAQLRHWLAERQAQQAQLQVAGDKACQACGYLKCSCYVRAQIADKLSMSVDWFGDLRQPIKPTGPLPVIAEVNGWAWRRAGKDEYVLTSPKGEKVDTVIKVGRYWRSEATAFNCMCFSTAAQEFRYLCDRGMPTQLGYLATRALGLF